MVAYFILAAGVIPSAMIFFYTSQSEYRRFRFQTRIASGWYHARRKTRDRFNDEALNQLLRQSGLHVKAQTYHYTRILLTMLFALLGISLLLKGNVFAVLFPIIVWYGLEYKKPFPMYYGFIAMKKQAAIERNGSLYLLYRLMLQEIVAFQDHPISVNEMMRRQLTRVPKIRLFMERCLDQWENDPAKALKRFGEDIGTDQARTFAHMLTQINEAGTKVALDVFQTNHESFRADRVSAFFTQLNTRALFASMLTLIGFTAVSYDIQALLQIYAQMLLKSTTG